MDTSALIAMILVGGFVWGGFLLFVVHGIRMEKSKSEESGAR